MTTENKRKLQIYGSIAAALTIIATSVSAFVESRTAHSRATYAKKQVKISDHELEASYKAIVEKLADIEKHHESFAEQIDYLETRQTLLEHLIINALSGRPEVRNYRPPARPDVKEHDPTKTLPPDPASALQMAK